MKQDNIPKFYQPSQSQYDNSSMQSIMEKIHNQQSSIMKMLEKYRDVIPDITPHKITEETFQERVRKYEPKTKREGTAHTIDQPKNKKITKLEKIRQENIKNRQLYQLPNIYTKKQGSINHKRKSKKASGTLEREKRNNSIGYSQISKNQNSVVISSDNDSQNFLKNIKPITSRTKPSKNSKNDQVGSQYSDKVEFEKKMLYERLSKPFHEKSSQTNTPKEYIDPNREQIDRLLAEKDVQNVQEQLKLEHQIMKPLSVPISIKKTHAKDQSSDQSDQETVPLKHYAKQLDSLFKAQCKEQINFLYFSTTSQMKQWSKQVMELFKKHDQQIEKQHKKNNYLKQFDDVYFTAGVYTQKKKR